VRFYIIAPEGGLVCSSSLGQHHWILRLAIHFHPSQKGVLQVILSNNSAVRKYLLNFTVIKMRFSISAAIVALPALAAAQEGFEQYKAQFQNIIGNFASYIPNPGVHNPVAAAEAKLGSLKLHTLTLENWKDTLYEPVTEGATEPVEWWVLTSGRNSTCRGKSLRLLRNSFTHW
jgi:hypothetical protein